MKISDISPDILAKFSATVYLIEADTYARYSLWEKHGQNSWQQDTSGFLWTVGHIQSRPINLEVYWHLIKGYRVGFYHSPSQLIDWKMIESWLDQHLPHLKRGDQRLRCYAEHFHTCLQHLESLQ